MRLRDDVILLTGDFIVLDRNFHNIKSTLLHRRHPTVKLLVEAVINTEVQDIEFHEDLLWSLLPTDDSALFGTFLLSYRTNFSAAIIFYYTFLYVNFKTLMLNTVHNHHIHLTLYTHTNLQTYTHTKRSWPAETQAYFNNRIRTLT